MESSLVLGIAKASQQFKTLSKLKNIQLPSHWILIAEKWAYGCGYCIQWKRALLHLTHHTYFDRHVFDSAGGCYQPRNWKAQLKEAHKSAIVISLNDVYRLNLLSNVKHSHCSLNHKMKFNKTHISNIWGANVPYICHNNQYTHLTTVIFSGWRGTFTYILLLHNSRNALRWVIWIVSWCECLSKENMFYERLFQVIMLLPGVMK